MISIIVSALYGFVKPAISITEEKIFSITESKLKFSEFKDDKLKVMYKKHLNRLSAKEKRQGAFLFKCLLGVRLKIYFTDYIMLLDSCLGPLINISCRKVIIL